MNIGICYNHIMEFDPIVFRNFIRNKFAEWRGKGRDSLGDYANFVGVSQQVMSNWYNGKLKRRPDAEKYNLLIKKYGDEAYDVLCIPKPTQTIGLIIPLLGRVTAGQPIPMPPSDFTYFDYESRISILKEWLPPSVNQDSLFALEVSGHSMEEINIHDGDTIILTKTNMAQNGDIVAVRLDDDDAVTLKKFYRENGHVRLQPANGSMEPIIVDAKTVHIEGRVVLSIRRW